MYLRTAALVLLVSLAVSFATEDIETSDIVEAKINSYVAPQAYAYGSCAMRKRMYQEQYYYGSSEDHSYEHHEHNEGHKSEHQPHHDHKHGGYGADAAIKGKVSTQDQGDAKTADVGVEAVAQATKDATMSVQLMSVDSEPAAAKPSLLGQGLEQLLHHRTEPGSGFYMQAPIGSGAPVLPGWNGLLEDGQPCLSDWACCSGKCSESICCSIEKLSNTQACSDNINCCSNHCVAVNGATYPKICCKAGAFANSVQCVAPTDCCSNNCLPTGLKTNGVLNPPICCPAGSQAAGGPCRGDADCCGSDNQPPNRAFCHGNGRSDAGTCCPGLIATGKSCKTNDECCSGICGAELFCVEV